MPEPQILFVCTANVSRSPWAEARGRQLLPGFAVDSVGTQAMRGASMDEAMAHTLPDGAAPGHRARQITPQAAREASVILAMEGKHRTFVTEEYPFAIRKTFTLGQFIESIRRAPEGLGFDELVLWAYRNRRPTRTETDVPDPYGKGQDVADACAAQLEGLLTALAAGIVAEDG